MTKVPSIATLKKYGVDTEFYLALFELQHGVCAVCGKAPLPDGMPLVIDHKHFKVIVEPSASMVGWRAKADLDIVLSWQWAKTKDAAIKAAKVAGMPYSIRGLLCPGRWSGCNRLMGRIDDIPWLEKTLAYLKNPPARRITVEQRMP